MRLHPRASRPARAVGLTSSLIPELVALTRGALPHCGGRPLADPRSPARHRSPPLEGPSSRLVVRVAPTGQLEYGDFPSDSDFLGQRRRGTAPAPHPMALEPSRDWPGGQVHQARASLLCLLPCCSHGVLRTEQFSCCIPGFQTTRT